MTVAVAVVLLKDSPKRGVVGAGRGASDRRMREGRDAFCGGLSDSFAAIRNPLPPL